MFVAMDKLSNPTMDSKTKTNLHRTVQFCPSQIHNDPLKLGDKVIFFNENDEPVNGVLRWIGRNRDILNNGSKIVGLETVSQLYT